MQTVVAPASMHNVQFVTGLRKAFLLVQSLAQSDMVKAVAWVHREIVHECRKFNPSNPLVL